MKNPVFLAFCLLSSFDQLLKKLNTSEIYICCLKGLFNHCGLINVLYVAGPSDPCLCQRGLYKFGKDC